MAISANNSKTIYAPASSTYGYTLKTEFTETGTNTGTNTSTISCTASLSASKIAYSVSNGGTLAVYWHDNYTNTDTLVKSITVSSCGNGGGSNYGTKTASGTITATHKSDGTLSGYSKAVFTKDKSNSYIPASNNVSTSTTALTTIPRQAFIDSATPFNDEQNPTITYTNSAGNAVSSLQACIALTTTSAQTTPEVAYRDVSKTGSSYTFTLTDAERNTLRNAMSTQKSRNVWFYLKTVINGTTYYAWKIAALTIVNANPSIDTLDYADINSVTTDVTNDDKIIIQNQSRVQFSFYDVVALKGASLDYMTININGNITNVTMGGTGIASTTYTYGEIDVSEDTAAVITLYDTRGNFSSYNLPITIWEYYQPTAIINVSREANFYTESNINVDAKYASLDNNNTIAIEFRIKKTTDNVWGAWTSVSDNVETQFNADNLYAWDLQVQLYDLFETNTYTIYGALDVGIPLMFFDLLRRSVGVNSIPDINNTLVVNDIDLSNTYSTTEQKIGTWIDGKPIYRQVISFTTTSTADSDVQILALADVDKMINIYGNVETTNLEFPINSYYSNTFYSTIYYASNDQHIRGKFGSNLVSSNCTCTIEYTKTTD